MTSSPTIVPTRDGYNAWSAIYDSEGNPLIALEEPLVDGLLGDIAGHSIADIGCGTGRHSLRLAARGANVTALDFSHGMLEQARRKPKADRVRFIEHDIATRLPLPDESFDRVICALVIDHVANLEGLFRELGRICRPDGRIIISSMHPAMMLKGVQARFTDPSTGIETRPESVPNQLSDYITAIVAAKLHIDHISEHIADANLAQIAPRAEKHLGWPLLLMLRLTPNA